VIAAAHDLGIDAEIPPNPAIALGSAELSLLDLTGAYASIAAGRLALQPWAMTGASASVTAEPKPFPT
jgi:membrane peptidoglycan carboxypeptidase